MRAVLPALCLAAFLSGCATPSPETRVRNSLISAGISRPVAGCMAERMVKRLSMVQLRKLSSLSKIADKPVDQMSINEILHRVRALGDPEILGVVTTAGLGCAIAG